MILICAAVFRLTFLTFVDGHEIGYQFNKTTGEITVLDRTGYFFVVPFYTEVFTIDGRPTQVRIEANNRVLNAKLVKFKRSADGVKQFIQLHGLRDYEYANTSSGSSTTKNSGSLGDILMSYAYENVSKGVAMSDDEIKKALENKYPFLEILSTGTNTMQPLPPMKDSTNSGVTK